MAQRQYFKLADQTSGTATQLTIALPATGILPATGTGTSGVSLSTLDGLLIVGTASAAVALSQGVTILGTDGVLSNVQLVAFNPPAAVTTPIAYFYGPSFNGANGASVSFNAAGILMDKISVQATPGAASTVRLVVYGIRQM